jgi:hypothetical protein
MVATSSDNEQPPTAAELASAPIVPRPITRSPFRPGPLEPLRSHRFPLLGAESDDEDEGA